jgi:hypothetical protein
MVPSEKANNDLEILGINQFFQLEGSGLFLILIPLV